MDMLTTIETPSATEAIERFDALRLRHARAHGEMEQCARQHAELTEKVSMAKGRLAVADEVASLLDAMQNRAHERSVGLFEQLLTAVLQDVLPDKGQVRLQLSTERNLPSLDVLIENQDALEDVLEGNGGAVTNVISAGLRYAALARSSNRRFIALDEPDCWLKPDRVPAFVRVLADVSAQTGVQTLVISHHDVSYFEGHANIVRLRREDGRVEVETLEPRLANWPDDETPGIRAIRLENFRAHTDTRLEFGPGLTAIVGDNDLGKSTAIISSMRALGYGESDDSCISHGADFARITLWLEAGRRIVWLRKRKGSPKVTYELWDGDKQVAEGRPTTRGSVPEWVQQHLGICKVDELDIQVGGQKSPVFLLDAPPSRRAQVLSVGREAGYLHQLLDSYAELKRRDREIVRDGDARVARLALVLGKRPYLESCERVLVRAADKARAITQLDERRRKLEAALARMASLQETVRLRSMQVAAFGELPSEAPKLTSLEPLAKLIARIERAQALERLSVGALPEVPVRPPLERLREMGSRIARLSRLVSAGDRLESMPDVPDVTRVALAARYMSLLETRTVQATKAQAVCVEAERALEEGTAAFEAFKAELGACPLCGSTLNGKEHVHG